MAKKTTELLLCDDCCREVEQPGLCDCCREAYNYDAEPVGNDVKEGK